MGMTREFWVLGQSLAMCPSRLHLKQREDALPASELHSASPLRPRPPLWWQSSATVDFSKIGMLTRKMSMGDLNLAGFSKAADVSRLFSHQTFSSKDVFQIKLEDRERCWLSTTELFLLAGSQVRQRQMAQSWQDCETYYLDKQSLDDQIGHKYSRASPLQH